MIKEKRENNFNWTKFLSQESKKPYFIKIIKKIKEVRNSGKIIYPKDEDIFNALRYTEFQKIKVVILGQDPYHHPNQSHGLSFSVFPSAKIPPSLRNIYRELKDDVVNFKIPNHGCLIKWARQGVLLLNSILTVERGKPLSHGDIGWQIFTDRIISQISLLKSGVVFLLWGNFAKRKRKVIDENRHYILESTHPSPFSSNFGFFGCKHFSKTNRILKEQKLKLIDWNLS
ncbi:uracil-DNA glycosylase [Candidatus Riesia pediculischaeffi]|uniref:Uracil-DNA glycosylase n=1 Tax=Candidatus Riesia pediculischaeffi PTSU TaxID=1401651 RepID=A0A0C1V5Q2_9ENTR|nr:uracil-DNA glycosylase [Candidatus Riesia pediculischaeffi]KIE63749.1 Uracil-DNA glycosylase, family 1 [Candidatus Riesia pediculischaeffi PTSU]